MSRLQIKNISNETLKAGDTTLPPGDVTEIDVDAESGLHISRTGEVVETVEHNGFTPDEVTVTEPVVDAPGEVFPTEAPALTSDVPPTSTGNV